MMQMMQMRTKKKSGAGCWEVTKTTVHCLVGSSMVLLHLLRKTESKVTEWSCRWIGGILSIGHR